MSAHRHRRGGQLLLLAATLLVAATARAQYDPFSGAYAPPPSTAPPPPARTGLFVRVSLGGTGLELRRSGHLAWTGGDNSYIGESRVNGGAGAFEATIGGALRPGLVIGFTFMSHELRNAVLDGGQGPTAIDGGLHAAFAGASLIVFPEPASGFHLGLSLGAGGAWMKAPPPAYTDVLGGTGGLLAADIGWAWRLADAWSFAAGARAAFAVLRGQSTQLGVRGSEDDRLSAFSLLVSLVYN